MKRQAAAVPGLQRIVWLASYPKSGNTWMRTFLANYFQPPGRILDINSLRRFTTADVRQDFFDRAAGRPWRGKTLDDWLRIRTRALHLIAASKPGHHFVKTHCQILRLGGIDLIPPEVTAAAIYIMRNPFDMVLSYARHTRSDLETAIGRITDPKNVHATGTGILEYLGRWDDHIRSWTMAPGLSRHVIRYEDMLADTVGVYRGLFAFLRLPVNERKLEEAMAASSFESLRRQEEEKGFIERPPGMERFFARGRSGAWREELTPEQVQRIRDEFRPTLERWYPELLPETEAFIESGGKVA